MKFELETSYESVQHAHALAVTSKHGGTTPSTKKLRYGFSIGALTRLPHSVHDPS